jgi:hypothetical protein
MPLANPLRVGKMARKWKFITPEIESVAAGFGSHHLKQRIGLPKGPLHHYTTGDNLIKILASGELWSTQAACMNDSKELIHAVERLAERVKLQKDATAADERLLPMWLAVDDLISTPDATGAPIFLSCFSEEEDDLSQWRAYASGEGGYSIGFDAKKLAELGGPNEVYLFPVDYDDARQNILLDDIIKWLVGLYLAPPGIKTRPPEKEWAEELVYFWLTNVSPFAVGMKHRAFQAEKEWRLFQYCRPEEAGKFQFRQRSSFMSRHLPLRIVKPLPIVSVRVGPCRHPELSRIAVGDLLLKHGYSPDTVPVKRSEVPYRQS